MQLVTLLWPRNFEDHPRTGHALTDPAFCNQGPIWLFVYNFNAPFGVGTYFSPPADWQLA